MIGPWSSRLNFGRSPGISPVGAGDGVKAGSGPDSGAGGGSGSAGGGAGGAAGETGLATCASSRINRVKRSLKSSSLLMFW
ncbi:MAG: hypothetical protein DWB42_17325 [Chloroflexi bacterium]|nr:hypothetical protein [Chloroflexota bacterium]